MRSLKLHSWQVSTEDAAAIQRSLSAQVKVLPLDVSSVRYVAGADVSFSKGSNDVFAAVVVLSYPELAVVEERGVAARATFPYVPGFLSFREGPAVIEALEQLNTEPDVIIFDGQGVAHPRGLGIASHVGVLLDKPTIGCAKSVLVGKYSEPGPERGSISPLTKDGMTLGVALRTRARVAPVFVSVGHRVDLITAAELVLSCAPRYRLPEPTRRAHILSNRLRTGAA